MKRVLIPLLILLLAVLASCGTAQISDRTGPAQTSAASTPEPTPEPSPEPTPEPAPETDVMVTVSICADGELVLAAMPVTAPEATLDSAIRAAHERYCPIGAAGYDAGVSSEYGLWMITKVWGVETVPYVIRNTSPLGEGENADYITADITPISEGDNIILVADASGRTPPISLEASPYNDKLLIRAQQWELDFSTYRYVSSPWRGDLVDIVGNYLGTTNAFGLLAIDPTEKVVVPDICAIPGGSSQKPTPERIRQFAEDMMNLMGTGNHKGEEGKEWFNSIFLEGWDQTMASSGIGIQFSEETKAVYIKMMKAATGKAEYSLGDVAPTDAGYDLVVRVLAVDLEKAMQDSSAYVLAKLQEVPEVLNMSEDELYDRYFREIMEDVCARMEELPYKAETDVVLVFREMPNGTWELSDESAYVLGASLVGS